MPLFSLDSKVLRHFSLWPSPPLASRISPNSELPETRSWEKSHCSQGNVFIVFLGRAAKAVNSSIKDVALPSISTLHQITTPFPTQLSPSQNQKQYDFLHPLQLPEQPGLQLQGPQVQPVPTVRPELQHVHHVRSYRRQSLGPVRLYPVCPARSAHLWSA